jgi:hypothetical protein
VSRPGFFSRDVIKADLNLDGKCPDKGEACILMLLELSAFGTVDHEILLRLLQKRFGVHPTHHTVHK